MHQPGKYANISVLNLVRIFSFLTVSNILLIMSLYAVQHKCWVFSFLFFFFFLFFSHILYPNLFLSPPFLIPLSQILLFLTLQNKAGLPVM